MNKLSNNKRVSLFLKGFTLIELIITLALLAIISAIAIPSFIKYTEYSKAKVCSMNRQIILKEYHLYRVIENKENSNMVAEEFIQVNGHNICPKNGIISVINDNICCNIHGNDQQGPDDGDDGEVPYL